MSYAKVFYLDILLFLYLTGTPSKVLCNYLKFHTFCEFGSNDPRISTWMNQSFLWCIDSYPEFQ